MKSTILASAAAAFILALPAHAADPDAIAKALQAAKLAADAAQRADDAAKAAQLAAQAAQDAAVIAKAAAAAAGLTSVSTSDGAQAAARLEQKVAQTSDPNSKPAEKSGTGDGNDDGKSSSAREDGASAYLTANTEGGNATIKYDWYGSGKEGRPDGSYFNKTFTLSSPLSNGAKSVDIATLDGLASGANVGFGLTAGTFASNFLPNANLADYVLAGAQARIGYKKYKYLNSTTLKEESSEKYSQSLAVYLGYATSASVLYLAKFDYQRAYKEADGKVLCPQAQTFPVTCVSGAADPPKQQTKRIFSLTTRFMGKAASAEVTLSYDRASRAKGIDVPVYFLQSKEKNDGFTPYSAGLRFGWRSDTKDPSVGIFVGSPFKFWGL